MRRRLGATAGLALGLALTAPAAAQSSRGQAASPTTTTSTRTRPGNIRAHVGTEQASWLIGDVDERIRGIERAAAIGTPESIALLVETIERNQAVKADSRALLALARALSKFADQERARTGLMAIVGAGNPSLAGRISILRNANGDLVDEGDPVARMELARETAAIALARSGVERSVDTLYAAARGGGSGQQAAITALGLFPPREPGFFGTQAASLSVPVIKMLGRLGDLRALDVLQGATKSTDVNIRCAALVALAELGDERAIPLARTAIAEADARLRAASGEVFILLTTPERFKATLALVTDDATVTVGLHLAERVYDTDITKAVSARANESPNREVRIAAIRALGRSTDPGAAKALVSQQILVDDELSYLAIAALARSPAPDAGAIIGGLLPTRLSALAVRAYVVRALERNERINSSDDAVFALAKSAKPSERALGAFAKIALGEAALKDFLDDKEPRVRRAAAMASLAMKPGDWEARNRLLIRRLAHEDDAVTRQVLSIGLLGGDPDGTVKTSTLLDRAESGGGDAPLAAFVLAKRGDATTARKVGLLVGARDPILRAHAARGLGASTEPDATGRLAELYTWETDADVRRAAIGALAQRTGDASAPVRKDALSLASELDPDGAVRQAARRALAGVATPFAPAAVSEVAWLRLTLDGGAAPGEPYVGSIVRADGLAIPIVFDEDGYAVIPGLPPGDARLVLAPRLPSEGKKP